MRLLIFKVVDNLSAKLGVINPASPDAVAEISYQFYDLLKDIIFFLKKTLTLILSLFQP